MCLVLTGYKKKPKAERAKRNIAVFKVISKAGYGRYKNLYIDGGVVPWERGFLYSESEYFTIKKGYGDEWHVYGNCFHSVINKERARNLMYAGKYIIIEMIIPKGALYFENDEKYASNKLLFPTRKKAKRS